MLLQFLHNTNRKLSPGASIKEEDVARIGIISEHMLLLAVSVLHSVLALLGLVFNGFLLGLALFKSPKSIGTYSILVIARAAADACACLFDIFSQSRPIPSGLTLGIASTGVCKYLSAWSCFLGYSLQLHFHTFSLHLLVICFAYRYYVLLERDPRRKQLLFVICLVHFPSFFQTVFVLMDNNSPEDVRLLIKIHHPEYEMKGLVVNGHTDLRHFPSVFAYLLMLIPVIPSMILVHILRRKIHFKLRNAILRPEVREKHRQLTFALSVQAIIPIVFVISGTCFLFSQLKLVESPILESFTLIPALLVPILNPLLAAALIRPYRETILRAVGLDPKEWSISKDGSVAPGDPSMFGSFDASSTISVCSALSINEVKNPFE